MLNLTRMTRYPVLTVTLTCFLGLSGMSAHAGPPDGKTLDECIEISYNADALVSGIGRGIVSLLVGNAINNAAGMKLVGKDDKLEQTRKSMEDAEDAAIREPYMKHYANCMRRHPEWHMKSGISRRDFLDDSEKPAKIDGTAFIIDSLDGKTELELGENNVITAKIRVHAPDRQGQKLIVRHSLAMSKVLGLGSRSIENVPFPGEDEERVDLVDGVFTYRFDIQLPPENEKTLFFKGQELIYEMRLYQAGKLVDRRILPFSIAEESGDTDMDFDIEPETEEKNSDVKKKVMLFSMKNGKLTPITDEERERIQTRTRRPMTDEERRKIQAQIPIEIRKVDENRK